MTSSPDLIHELRASRPSAPLELRARVREISSEQARPQRAVGDAGASRFAASDARRRTGSRSRSPSRAPGCSGSRAQTSPRPRRCSGRSRLQPTALRARPASWHRAPWPTRGSSPSIAAYGRSRAARERNADRRSLGRRCRVARGTGRSRPHPHARRLRRVVVGGHGRGGKCLDHRPRSGREGAGRDHGPVRARAHRLAAGHDRRPAGDARRARAPRGDRAGPDRPHPRTAADRVARRTDRSGAPRAPADAPQRADGVAHGHLRRPRPKRGCRRSSSPS